MEQDDETDRLTSRRIRYCERKSFSTVSSSALALDEFQATLFGVLSGDGGTGGDPGITRRRFDASDVGVPPWSKFDDTVGQRGSRIIKAFQHAPMVPRSPAQLPARTVDPSVCPERRVRRCRRSLFTNRAVSVMEVGPPGSPCRRGSQTTASCVGQEPSW